MKAVWCTPHAFGADIQVGAHHLAKRLAARGWDVLFLTNPVSPAHLLKWSTPDVRLRLKNAAAGLSRDAGVATFTPLTLLPMAGRTGAGSAWMLAQWPQWTIPNLARTLHRAGFAEPDLLVLDGPVALPVIDIIKPRKTILRVLDRLSAFASTTPAINDALAAAAKKTDLVTYSADALSPDVASLGPRRAMALYNGVDVAHFRYLRAEPAAYAAIPQPRAVYVGAMTDWFDFALVEGLARARPGISFVLLGPDATARRRLLPLPNLHRLGPVPWDDLPGYLQHAQVGLIPFATAKSPDLVNAVNPLKLYEYAASGLPVVASDWQELRRIDAPIALCNGLAEFLRAIDQALATPTAPDRLRGFVAGRDWDMVLTRLLQAVGLEQPAT